jgi:hypothetical protein
MTDIVKATSNRLTVDSSLNFDHLDDLFAQARAEEPDLFDDNFTKTVMNSLPTSSTKALKLTNRKRQYLPDLIGITFGLIAVFLFVDPVNLANSVLSLWPNVSISPMSMITAVATLSAGAGVAWWSIERSPTF